MMMRIRMIVLSMRPPLLATAAVATAAAELRLVQERRPVVVWATVTPLRGGGEVALVVSRVVAMVVASHV